MKKFLISLILYLSLININIHAQENKLGYFNSFSIGANVGTTGWGIDIATPIGQHLSLRAGFTIMPNFNYSDNVDAFGDSNNETSMEIEGSMGRNAGEVLLNLYPSKRKIVFITGGFVFGGDKLLKIKGHSDELANLGNANIQIADYSIPVDKNGNVSGGIKVSSFRPYIGLGLGRIVPKNKRIGFLFEFGLQFHKFPEVYTEYESIEIVETETDDNFSDLLSQMTVYPVLRFRLCGKFF